MSSLLASVARSLTAHWKRGLIGLVVVIALVGVAVGSQSGKAAQDFAIPGTESQKAQDLLESKFPAAAGAQSQVVYSVEDGRIGAAQRETIAGASQKIAALPHVIGSAAQLDRGLRVSEDGRTALSTVQYDRQSTELEPEDGKELETAARTAEGDGLSVALRGETVDLASQQEAPVGELIGVGIAIILLTILFRSLAAMFVTLIGALVGVFISQLILAAVSKPIGIPDFATTIAVMLGLGAGIDYALVIFSRFREQLAAGDTPPEAAARANATSGTSVVAAGLIVMVAIAGLLAVGIPLVGKMGVGSAIAVAMVVISSITVLPIFAGALARWLKPKDPKHVAASPGFARWGRRLTRRPWIPVIAGGVVLLILTIPVTDLRLGQPDDGNQPAEKTQRVAYDQLSKGFGPGSNGPLLLAVGSKDGGTLDRAELTGLTRELRGTKGVAQVAPPQPNRTGDAAIVSVIPRTSPQDKATSALVDRLRDRTIPAATRDGDLNVYVGGLTASFEDFSDKISSRLPLFIGIVIGLSILLLIAVFRSIWVPLASAVFNLLSIGAAYGVVVAVFQWGWGASLLGAAEGTPIVSFIPLMMFAILFGLSMDYNVFLLSRIREAYFEGDSPKESVAHGLSRIAKVILTAGLIMASVFLGFATGDDTIVKMFGVGLGAAILIDVLIVRMVVSPALMALLGDKAWWIPDWLDRALPNVSLEGGHEDRAGKVEERERQPAGV
ncbi:MAG TPA: MMPL family transporter [Thermoleophilaceae bacterium]|nr:MMPL family transporter [Thermoleophilaceae bacterium]